MVGFFDAKFTPAVRTKKGDKYQELIECALVVKGSATSKSIKKEFHCFIKPIENQTAAKHIDEYIGITQADFDRQAKGYFEAISELIGFAHSAGLGIEFNDSVIYAYGVDIKMMGKNFARNRQKLGAIGLSEDFFDLINSIHDVSPSLHQCYSENIPPLVDLAYITGIEKEEIQNQNSTSADAKLLSEVMRRLYCSQVDDNRLAEFKKHEKIKHDYFRLRNTLKRMKESGFDLNQVIRHVLSEVENGNQRFPNCYGTYPF